MFKLDESFGFVLNRAALAMKWALEEKLQEYDLTGPQWAVLARLWEENGQPVSYLGHSLRMDKPTVTGIVDRLNQKGLLSKKRDTRDRRIIRVYLTVKGKELKTLLPPLAKEVNLQALDGMTKQEILLLNELLIKIWNNLEQ